MSCQVGIHVGISFTNTLIFSTYKQTRLKYHKNHSYVTTKQVSLVLNSFIHDLKSHLKQPQGNLNHPADGVGDSLKSTKTIP